MPFVEVYGNIVIPILSAVLLFIYFLYFTFIDDSKSDSSRYFRIFLISFCVFLVGRPVQILSGPHPIPLVINNIRSFIFAAVTIPMIMLADFSRADNPSRTRFWLLIITGSALGAIYSVFNTLTTTGSGIIFYMGGIPVADSVTPKHTPPYYGREVTIATYIAIATLLFVDSVAKIRRVAGHRREAGINLPRVYLFNSGKLVFALTFFLGSILHQWWVYYVGSLVSVFVLGYAVALDIRDSKQRMKRVTAFVKEDLIQDLSTDAQIHDHVMDLLTMLNIPKEINTFIVLQESAVERIKKAPGKDRDDGLAKDLSYYLEGELGSNQFILIPIGTDRIGICLAVPPNEDFGRSKTIALCENIKRDFATNTDLDIGIGRSYSGIDDLRKSYQEAFTAIDYVSRIEGGQVVHISDIQDGEARIRYPLKEKAAFLSAIRMGDREIALAQLQELSIRLFTYGTDRDRLARVRIYELLGATIESAISGGGDVDELLELSERYYNESTIIRSHALLTEWLKSLTEEIVDVVTRSHSNRYDEIVRKAMRFIDEHFAENISVKDVADEVNVSESYFKSIFKKGSGYSYSEYLTRVRIEKAKELLHTTEKSVTEIAMDIGFHTPNSFSTLFRREVGVSPSQYKKGRNTKPNSTIP